MTTQQPRLIRAIKNSAMTAVLLASCSLAAVSAQAFETTAKQLYAYDIQSKTVLLSKDAKTRMYPASMTKMMTAYLLFKELKQGKVTLKGTFRVSETAWKKGGSKMFVELGADITIGDLLQGILIQSGNDACIVVAEGMAGSEEEFAKLMTNEAKRIGMTGTQYRNSTGWPDEEHYTTAQDLGTLAERLITDFPEYYHYFAQDDFTYHNIKQANRNLLLGRVVGVDGLKTGHTDASGYGITVSAVDPRDKNGRRVVVVVNGLTSEKERADEAEKTVTHTMLAYQNIHLGDEGDALARIPVWMGAEEAVSVGVENSPYLTLKKSNIDSTKIVLRHAAYVKAPIKKGDTVGVLVVNSGDDEHTVPVVATHDVVRAGFWRRLSVNLSRFTGNTTQATPNQAVEVNAK